MTITLSSDDSPPTVTELSPAVAVAEQPVVTHVEPAAVSRLRELEEKYQAAQRRIADLERQQAPLRPTPPTIPGMMFPQATPELTSLDNRAAIHAWLNAVRRFCELWAIPEALRVEWASTGLKGSAANAWATMTFRQDVSTLSFLDMEDMLMKKFFQQHSLYTLWGRWTSLRQGLHETSQAYCDRV